MLNAKSNQSVSINDLVSKHIGILPAALPSFLDDINEQPGFRADGIFLVPGEVVPTPTVFELIVAIMQDYKDRGWDIT